jgi:hypothetical protein
VDKGTSNDQAQGSPKVRDSPYYQKAREMCVKSKAVTLTIRF